MPIEAKIGLHKKTRSRSGANAANPFVINASRQKPRSKTVKNVLLFNNRTSHCVETNFSAPEVVQNVSIPFITNTNFAKSRPKTVENVHPFNNCGLTSAADRGYLTASS
jgi:hypothetical protein